MPYSTKRRSAVEPTYVIAAAPEGYQARLWWSDHATNQK